MSCYFRYIKDFLSEAGINVTKENKKDIDRAFHKIVNVDYKNCSKTWKKIKAIVKSSNENLKVDLRDKLKSELKI